MFHLNKRKKVKRRKRERKGERKREIENVRAKGRDNTAVIQNLA